MLGMLYSRKKYCMRHILEGLKRNVRGHAETCLLIIFSSRGCVVFSPIFLSNFLGGCPNHEKIKQACTFGWYPEVWLSRHGLTFHGVGWWERARWVRTEQQNVHRSRLGAKSMIHSCKIRKPKKNTKKTRTPRKPRRPTGPECLRHRVVFCVFFCFSGFCLQFCMPQGKDAESWILSCVCSFACPKAKMQRVESCHLLAFLSINAYVKTENVQRGMQNPLFC